MKLLLDTNAILAVLGDARPLNASVEATLSEPDNEKIVSVVSFWEMTIKATLGKLRMAMPPEMVWKDFEHQGIATVLSIRADHLQKLGVLPRTQHRDPFDRLIVAQALCEDCDLVSSDSNLDVYGVRRIW